MKCDAGLILRPNLAVPSKPCARAVAISQILAMKLDELHRSAVFRDDIIRKRGWF
jgi:hypothetical protein